ncbi:E3 ubiquitin-protein ligase MARCHF5 [Drosophila sulfurigaster albostrigata]|uniref:E3 ubiquitin-protein ligase MARCHF5 n=1 Tax=Drosophila sulfurigaster albostrigata TaxID=89887 RepID=UPI002D21DB8B|nr:E3 ubiquitin-protein ligase MARCHF5 [Drosophila sulfurigaster albostrigata]
MSTPRQQQQQHHLDDQEELPFEERTCWICLASEAENRRAIWLHPCQCRGSTKWVHESCLSRWIDEKQNGDTRMRVSCMQCRVEYLIMFPKISRIGNILESMQDLIRQCSPILAVSIFLMSVYWTAVTYGGLTVLQVCGQERGMELIEKGDAFFVLLALPFIPVGLVLSRLVRWEDAMLRLWHNRRSVLRKLPLINWLCGGLANTTTTTATSLAAFPHPPLPEEPFDVARTFCGAILLPTISMLTGIVLYSKVQVPLHRTLLGGITFIGLKGAFKIYLRQRQYLYRTRRHIVDYTEENLRAYGDNSQAQALRQNAGYQDADADDEDENEDEEQEQLNELLNVDDDVEQVDEHEMDMIMTTFGKVSIGTQTTNTAFGTFIDTGTDTDSDDGEDVRDHLVVTVPDRPFSLLSSER